MAKILVHVLMATNMEGFERTKSRGHREVHPNTRSFHFDDCGTLVLKVNRAIGSIHLLICGILDL